MPVIRGEPRVSAITAQQRDRIAHQLQEELSGVQTPNGPIIFEIPFEQSDRIDVLAVWDSWADLNSSERSQLLLDAYASAGPHAPIAQALGVTYREAVDQQLLPYAVVPLLRRGEASEEQCKRSMLAEGGFTLPNGKVDLRFPTMPLAERTHRRLTDAIPNGYWSIVQAVGYPQ